MAYPYQYPYPPMDNLNQLKAQQFQQPMFPTQMPQPIQQPQYMQPAGINGKIVQSIEAINPNDVPMDGSVAIFPKSDMTEIYGKSWNADGTIRTIVFRPVDAAMEPATSKIEAKLSDETTAALMERFDDVIDRIAKLEKSITPAKNTRTKKETDVNE